MALTSLAFLAAFFGGLGLSIFRGPIWGLYTYLAVFYLHPPSRWWGTFLPDLRWSLLAAVVTLACVFWHRKPNPERKPFFSNGIAWIFALYVLWMWVQILFVPSDDHLDGVVLFTKYFVLLYLIYAIIDTPEKVRNFLLAHVVGCFYLAWLAYTAEGAGRLEGVGGPGIDDSNTMSTHFGTGIVVAAALLLTEKRWRYWLPVIALPFLLNGMMQGGSRGAFVGLVAGGLTLFWLKPPAFRKRFMLYAALGGVCFAMLALPNELFMGRITSLRAVTAEDEQLDFSAQSRLVIIKAEWEMFWDYPLGVGHAGTAFLSPRYLAPEYLTWSANGIAARSSHNIFMQVIVDQGIPGMVLLAALLVCCVRNVRAVTKRSGGQDPVAWTYGAAIAAGLVVVVVAGQFAPYLKAEVQYWLLALLMCMRALKDAQLATEKVEPAIGKTVAVPGWGDRAAAGPAVGRVASVADSGASVGGGTRGFPAAGIRVGRGRG